MYLDDANSVADLPDLKTLAGYKSQGIHFWAPPTFALLAAEGGKIVPSQAAKDARAAGLGLDHLDAGALGHPGRRQQRLVPPDLLDSAVKTEGDSALQALHVLAKEVGVVGVFSDWPATTTFYANCMNLR